MALPDNQGPGEMFVRSNNGNVLEVMAGSPDTVRIPLNAVMRDSLSPSCSWLLGHVPKP
jgi:hypothetical protein